jgi:hypothetical protein
MSRKPRSVKASADASSKEQAAEFAGEAVRTLVELMRNSGSDPVRVAAARELLDRAHGKPKAETAAAEGDSVSDMVRAAFERKDP